MKNRTLQGFLLLLLILLWGGSLIAPTPAYAHARLLGSTPAPGSSLKEAPSDIDITLSEAVSLDFSAVQLLDRTREELPLGRVGYGSEGETSIKVPLQGSLAPGTYVVLWRVVSAVDGHLTTGSFVFRVVGAGESPAATPEPLLGGSNSGKSTLSTGEERPTPLHWVVRALVLICITFCLGGPIFLVLVIDPTVEERGLASHAFGSSLRARFAQLGAVAAATMVPLLALDLWAQVAAIGQVDLWGALGRADLAGPLVSTTRYGFAWAMKLLAASALFAMFLYVWARRKSGAGLWEIAIAAGSLFLLSESLSSHAAAVQGENVAGLPLPVISDWVHLVTASTWIGGLLFFVLVLFPTGRRLRVDRAERRAFLGAAVPRFSRLALVSVLVLGVSGTYNLAIQTTDLAAIASSLYGQVVGLKVLLFGVLIVVGAVNLAYLSPRLRVTRLEGTDSTISNFGRNVRLEVALMCVVVLCAGGLTLLPPPSPAATVAASEEQGQGGLTLRAPGALRETPTSTAAEPVAAATSVAGTSLSLAVAQADAGQVFTFTLEPNSASSRVLTDVTRVLLGVSPQGVEAGSTVLKAEQVEQAPGSVLQWVARASVLAFQGDYLVTATAQRGAGRDIKAAFWLSLGADSRLSVKTTEFLEAQFRTVPEPPLVGPVRVIVDIRGSEGEAIGGIAVSCTATGPAGRELPLVPMSTDGGAAGRHSVDLVFPTPGAWVLKAKASRTGEPDLTFTASVDVGDKVPITP